MREQFALMIALCRAFAIQRVSWQKRLGGCTTRPGTPTRTPAVYATLDFGDLTAQWVWRISFKSLYRNVIYYNIMYAVECPSGPGSSLKQPWSLLVHFDTLTPTKQCFRCDARVRKRSRKRLLRSRDLQLLVGSV